MSIQFVWIKVLACSIKVFIKGREIPIRPDSKTCIAPWERGRREEGEEGKMK